MTNEKLSYIITKLISREANEANIFGGVTQLVEYPVHTRPVTCSSQVAATRPVGQAVKTPPFHGGNMGSIPVRVTKKDTILLDGVFFCHARIERSLRKVSGEHFVGRGRFPDLLTHPVGMWTKVGLNIAFVPPLKEQYPN